jgi:hypothetical protein
VSTSCAVSMRRRIIHGGRRLISMVVVTSMLSARPQLNERLQRSHTK